MQRCIVQRPLQKLESVHCIMYTAKIPGNQPKNGDNHSYGRGMRGVFKQETHRTALFERNCEKCQSWDANSWTWTAT